MEKDAKMVQPLNVVVDMDLINQIGDAFENQIKGFSKELRALKDPKEPEPTLAMEVKRKRGRKPTTKFIGEISFFFVLPEICFQKNINIDMLFSTQPYGGGRVSHRFTATQRLQNWKIQQKLRNDGVRDDYYYHLPSGQRFRSRPGVIQFVLYEIITPPKPKSVGVTGQQAKVVNDDNDPGSASNASSNKTASFPFPQEMEIENKMMNDPTMEECKSSGEL